MQIHGIKQDTRTVQDVPFQVSNDHWRHRAFIEAIEVRQGVYQAANAKPEMAAGAPIPGKDEKPLPEHVLPTWRTAEIVITFRHENRVYIHRQNNQYPADKDPKVANKARMFNERFATIVDAFMGQGWSGKNLAIVEVKEGGYKLSHPAAAEWTFTDSFGYVTALVNVAMIANEGRPFYINSNNEPIQVVIKLVRQNYGSNPNYLTLFANGNFIERIMPEQRVSLIQKHPTDVFDLIPQRAGNGPAIGGTSTGAPASQPAAGDWPDDI